MLEIKCQGANLTRFFTIWASQSPWAEVLQEGHCVGRTRPHQGGDKNPRWDDPPFVLDPSRGQQLVFRVLIPSSSVMGHKDVLCGEGTLAVPELMRQQQQFVLPLHKGGDPTGFLSFQWRILRDTREAPSRPQPERLERPERAHGHYAPAAPPAAGYPPQMAPPPAAARAQPEAPAQAPLRPQLPQQVMQGEQHSRLGLSERGCHEANRLMSSKDSLRSAALRPFNRPEMLGRSQLSFREFKDAFLKLQEELEVVDKPNEEAMRKLFQKHSSTQPDPKTGTIGLGPEEYEALLFRMLTFMLASGEVEVSSHGSPKAGEERDKRWREEFLKKNSQRFQEVYRKGRKLGEGSFGAVYEVAHRSNETSIRVCKVIQKSSADKVKTSHQRVREEFAVLKRLDHPHVVRIFEDFEDEQCFYLIMEPCRGGDLLEAVRNPMTRNPQEWEMWCAKVIQHTLSAVAYCHSKGIMHKDLKPENVMMSSKKGAPIQDLHVVVVDFGLAQMLSPEGRGTEIAGTPPFMSPEVWAGNFSQSCDIWSCGVMLFFMLSGTYPFMAKRIEEFPAAVAREPDWSRIGGASSEAQYICFDMLCKREADRPPAQELLSNAWFRRFGLGASSSDIQKLGRGLLQVKERSSFERFVARLVATQMDAGQLKRINEAFRTFDLDKDGSLSREELVRGLTTLGASAEEAQQVMEELDVGKTGRISYTEFLAGVTDLRQRSPMERDKLLKLAWQQFAPDQRGMVKTGSIQAALAARGLTVAELPKEFLKELRRGSAGEISFEAFRGLFAGDESCCVMNSFVGSLPRN